MHPLEGLRVHSRIAAACSACLLLMLQACGGGGGGSAGYALGGTLAGLGAGKQLLLLSGAGTQLTLKSNGNFRFAELLPDGARYNITVAEQPIGQTCVVSRATNSADVAGVKADALNATVLCADNSYAISGSVAGLTSGSTLVLAAGPQSTLSVTANGTFTMPVRLASGSSYAVTVQTQPIGSICTVAAGAGTIASTAITNVDVRCAPTAISVAGTVRGLNAASSVAIKLNEGSPLTLSANGAFNFPSTVAFGSPYAVTVAAQPSGQTCSVSNGTANLATANATDVQVVCSALQYSVGGQVIGLSTASSTRTLALLNNGGDELAVRAAGPFTFSQPVAHGSSFSVTVAQQPLGQTCTVSDGSAASVSSPVTSVSVQCLSYVWRTSLIAGSGTANSADGVGSQAGFNGPTAVAIDPWGRLVVADMSSSRLRRVIPSQGAVTTIAGAPVPGYSDSAVSLNAAFQGPSGVAVDAQGNIFVADTLNHAIRRISVVDGSVATLAGNGQAGAVNGLGPGARFNSPRGLALDRNGDLIVADTGNHAIRRVSPQGVVTTVAGVLETRGRNDGPAASALFNGPVGVAIDSAGIIYVADTQNALIRAISPVSGGWAVTTIAGSGSTGWRDGSGSFAAFNLPMGLVVDSAGTLYVADSGNHAIRQIQMGGNSGTVMTVVGSGRPGGQDGIGVEATLNSPVGLAFAPGGLLYLTEAGGQRIRVMFRASN